MDGRPVTTGRERCGYFSGGGEVGQGCKERAGSEEREVKGWGEKVREKPQLVGGTHAGREVILKGWGGSQSHRRRRNSEREKRPWLGY